MSNKSSIAPKERVNIVFKSSIGDQQEEKELPLRLLMLGDYSLSAEEKILEDIPVIDVNKNNFDDVLASKNIELGLVVTNKLVEEEQELPVSLRFDKLADFSPDAIVTQVPELRKLLEIRHALTSLKGPLGNIPSFRKHIQKILQDESARKQLLLELDKEIE